MRGLPDVAPNGTMVSCVWRAVMSRLKFAHRITYMYVATSPVIVVVESFVSISDSHDELVHGGPMHSVSIIASLSQLLYYSVYTIASIL